MVMQVLGIGEHGRRNDFALCTQSKHRYWQVLEHPRTAEFSACKYLNRSCIIQLDCNCGMMQIENVTEKPEINAAFVLKNQFNPKT